VRPPFGVPVICVRFLRLAGVSDAAPSRELDDDTEGPFEGAHGVLALVGWLSLAFSRQIRLEVRGMFSKHDEQYNVSWIGNP
jgi:hypothetical protein